MMTRDVKDAFDVARRVVEKRLTKDLGRDIIEGEGYYIRDDVSCLFVLDAAILTVFKVLHRREDADHSCLYPTTRQRS